MMQHGSETEGLISRIDHVTAEVQGICSRMTIEQLNLQPDARSWSIAQILEHLILVYASYDPVWPLVRDQRPAAPWARRIPGYASLMGKMILSSVQPDNTRKVQTMAVWTPAPGAVQPDILEKFKACQALLKATISEFYTTHGNTVISSPANRNIIYSVRTACEILVAHEERHLQQIRQVTDLLLNQQ